MAGDGPDRDAIQSQAQRLGIDDLRFTGRITDMDAFYQQIDLLLHPALREPYGNVVAEALIAGVPVVATAVDGVPDVIRDGVDGRCVEPTLPLSALASFGGDPDQVYSRVWRPELQRVAEPGVPDPAALAEAVLQVAGDDARYAAFSAAAVDGLRRFDYAAHVEQLIGHLQQAGASGHAYRRRRSMRPYNCDDQQRPAWYDRADKAAQLIAALPAAGAGRARFRADGPRRAGDGAACLRCPRVDAGRNRSSTCRRRTLQCSRILVSASGGSRRSTREGERRRHTRPRPERPDEPASPTPRGARMSRGRKRQPGASWLTLTACSNSGV